MADEEPQTVGPWKRIKVLGRGGFGQVTLWHNGNTNEDIAIKKLRELELQGLIKNKQKERWCKEVEIMKKLNHLNIVKAVNLPQELNTLASTPILAMEYCNLGDLRQVLSKPQNCCGLKESTVISILKDISGGLSYLHSCKITHRDLKPDNVVLQQGDSRIIYKLIDLGYAKELDQNSICESFVGTIQYLAPELFMGKSYTCSVDFWSLGLLAHEIITGYRPFLPGFNPPDWMKQIQNKPRNIISVVENLNGEIVHSTTISRVNHISRCLLQEIEKWLQLALDWNGSTRGRDLETKEVILFDKLAAILNKKIIKVFSFPTYELLSYEIKADTDISTLRSCLHKDTGLEVDDQMLLLPSGKCMKSNGSIFNALQNETIDPDGVSLFLYACGPMKIRSRTLLKPLYVKELLEEPKKPLPYKNLKRSCSDSVFYLQSEAELYLCLLQAIRVKVENMKHRTTAVEGLFEDVAEEWNQVESFAQFLMFSHKTDLESYIHLRRAGELPSSGLVQKWIQKVTDVEKKLAELRNTSNKNQQKLSVTIARQNFQNLESNALVQPTERTILNDLVDDGQKLWDRVQKIPRDVRGIAISNTDMVKVLYKCIEQSCKLFKNPSLDMLFLQISETEERLTKLVSPLTIWLKSTKIMKQIIENTQKERQKEVWGLVMRPKGKEAIKEKEKKESENKKEISKDEEIKPVECKEDTNNVKDEPKENEFSPFHIPTTIQSDLKSPVEEYITVKPDFKIMEPVSIVPLKSDFSLTNSFSTPPEEISAFIQTIDANVIITDNNQLRYKTQDLTHSCHQMMKEIQSLNWDFLTDTT